MKTAVAPSEEAEPPIEMHERLPADIDADSLRKFFTLTPSDLEQGEHCRGPINRIGFAVQLCILRWRGHFLHDTRDVPGPVLETIASQLGVLPMPLDTYPHNEKTRFEHAERLRAHLHFRRRDATQRQRLLEHLITVAHAIPRSTALRQAAHRWLQDMTGRRRPLTRCSSGRHHHQKQLTRARACDPDRDWSSSR